MSVDVDFLCISVSARVFILWIGISRKLMVALFSSVKLNNEFLCIELA